jgi:hypothetical protein
VEKKRRELVLTGEARIWIKSLAPAKASRVAATVDHLATHGPGLGRPLADRVAGSRHHNMKELRIGTMRMLYAFDPRGRGVILVGGDKRGAWHDWYRENIPRADKLFDNHLRRYGKEGPGWRRDPPSHGR